MQHCQPAWSCHQCVTEECFYAVMDETVKCVERDEMQGEVSYVVSPHSSELCPPDPISHEEGFTPALTGLMVFAGATVFVMGVGALGYLYYKKYKRQADYPSANPRQLLLVPEEQPVERQAAWDSPGRVGLDSSHQEERSYPRFASLIRCFRNLFAGMYEWMSSRIRGGLSTPSGITGHRLHNATPFQSVEDLQNVHVTGENVQGFDNLITSPEMFEMVKL